MIELVNSPVIYKDGKPVSSESLSEESRGKTIASRIEP